jgi:hypothetical protein
MAWFFTAGGINLGLENQHFRLLLYSADLSLHKTSLQPSFNRLFKR